MKGYGGWTLRVNLSKGIIERYPSSERLLKDFIGGKGLGTALLYFELIRGLNPLSPENKLIITTGPITGTSIPLASKCSIHFKSPLTGIYGESQVGGFIGPSLKWCGLDALIVEGAAKEPVYLLVEGDRAEIRNAKHLWGMDTFEAEDALKGELGSDVEALLIGPAGENLVLFACICHRRGRQAGRCGAGAVMGFKKLKAIAVIPARREVEVADEEALNDFLNDLRSRLKEDPVAERLRRYGTPAMVKIANSFQAFPTRYWRKGFFEGYANISAEALTRITVKSVACWNCPYACGKLCEVKNGRYAGVKVEGPEYETIYAFGGLCEIGDIEAIAYLNELCDRLGLDTITAGNVAGFAIEASRSGALKTDFPLDYGNVEAVARLIRLISYRSGIGDQLANGVAKASKALNLEWLAVHVKGLEPAGYDPRALNSMALAYAVASRGACHLRMLAYLAEMRGLLENLTNDYEKVRFLVDWEDRFTVYDSLILCRFARDLYDWDELSLMLKAVTGIDSNVERLKLTAQRISSLIRSFNVREGLTRRDDTLPQRFFEEPIALEGKTVDKDRLERMLNAYYELRGWSREGLPL